jgi:hypothetical protein
MTSTMRNYLLTTLRVCLASLLTTLPAMAGGLSCSLGEVVVEHLQIGNSYDLTQLANTRLIVTNTDDHTVQLRIDILVPDTAELKLNAEAIPDPSWVKLSESDFSMPAAQWVESHIQISIPNDDRFLNRRYQVMIWSHTVPTAETGMFLACGLKTRIIFTTDSVRQPLPADLGTSSASSLQLDPAEIHWTSAKANPVGHDAAVEHRTITVTNTGERAQTVQLECRAVHESFSSLTLGFEDCPDPSIVSFSEKELELPAHGTKDVDLRLALPAAGLERGKSYMMIIDARGGGGAVESQVYARLYLTLN